MMMQTEVGASSALAASGALVAFAANSVLCRMALGAGLIDAGSFTSVRLLSGAAALALISTVMRRRFAPLAGGDALSSSLLALYAVAFSFAYLSLGAGTGALILFGSVQATMLLWARRKGERANWRQWVGLVAALAGLVYLVSPGLASPPFLGSALMTAAGVAWGGYSLRGRSAADPLLATTGNFLRAAPIALAFGLMAWRGAQFTWRGFWLAVLSGAFASGLGYVVWYAALRHLTATRAAILQLTVPVIAAAGGVLLLDETLSARLLLASALILGGVAFAVARQTTPKRTRQRN